MMNRGHQLIGLLNVNGSFSRMNQFHQPYQFNALTSKARKNFVEEVAEKSAVLVDHMRKMRMVNGALKSLRKRSYLNKFFKRNLQRLPEYSL